jgi:hypothetical protein
MAIVTRASQLFIDRVVMAEARIVTTPIQDGLCCC